MKNKAIFIYVLIVLFFLAVISLAYFFHPGIAIEKEKGFEVLVIIFAALFFLLALPTFYSISVTHADPEGKWAKLFVFAQVILLILAFFLLFVPARGIQI